MNFEDEQYVRVYTRKTITSKRLGWEGRTVLWHLMCECDRSGLIEVGDGDLAEALSVLLGDIPEEVINAAIPRLASQGVTERHGTKLLIVRFEEAQEAKRSDKVRAKELRARKKAEALTQRDAPNTQRDEATRSVTGRHETSLSAQLCSAVQSSEGGAGAPPPAPVQPVPTASKPPARDRFAESLTTAPTSVERHAFAAWATAWGKIGAAYEARRAECLSERVREGMTAQDADDAIAGALADEWVNGTRDGEKKTRLTVIFGSAENFEDYRDKGRALRERPSGILRKGATIAEREAADRAEANAARRAKGLPPLDDGEGAVSDPDELARILGSVGGGIG